MDDDMRAYVQSVDWHALAEKRLRDDDLAAHVADDLQTTWHVCGDCDGTGEEYGCVCAGCDGFGGWPEYPTAPGGGREQA